LNKLIPKWISVDDHLPPQRPCINWVLAQAHYKKTPEHKFIIMAYILDDHWMPDDDLSGYNLEEQGITVTHWMPLPKVC